MSKFVTHHTLLQLFKSNHINTFDIAVFLRQFATLVSAGISIVQSCDILEKSQEKISFRQLINAIKREILTGKNLFTCLQQHKHHFDELTCQLVQIGEHTGKLDDMLLTIATHQEKNLALKKRIQQALFYPCMVIFIAVAVTFCMFIFIIPQFAELFQTAQVKLPILTIFIFHLSACLKQNLWLFIFVSILSMLIFFTKFKYYLHQPLKRAINQCPPIKKYIHKMILARFARNFAITFAAGIPIKDSLKLAANASGSLECIDMVAKLRSKISTGLQLHHAMLVLPYFPPLMIQMIKIGEESGMLEHMLDKIADFFESDIDHLIARFSQLLEPLIMLILGAVIGGIVISMYLPIFKLGSAL